jgi:protein SCO1
MSAIICFLREKWSSLIAALLLATAAGCVAALFIMGYSRLPVVDHAYNFSLWNENGQRVRLQDSDDKIRLLTFIYTNCPTVCPTITQQLVALQNDMKQKGLFRGDVQFLAITIDPDRDTGAVLKTYAKQIGADLQEWQFLYGDATATDTVLQKYSLFVEKDQTSGLITHAVKTFLIDKNRNIRKVYGLEMNLPEIEKDIQSVLRES